MNIIASFANKMNTDTLARHADKLAARGILSAARAMHWSDGSNSWRFPVFDVETGDVITHYNKNYNSSAKTKYFWDRRGGKNGATWYGVPGLPEHVASAGGLVYIANGQPATLAYHAAGIYNVVSWFGEKNLPGTLAADFRRWQVARVVYVVDNDNTGRESGADVRDMLAGSGIDVEILHWSSDVAKYDANDYWIDCKFDAATFRAGHDTLKPADLPAPKPKRTAAITLDAAWRDGAQKLADAIVRALETTGRYKRNGEYLNGACIFPENHKHGDRNASAGVHIESGVWKCFACGNHAPADVARKIGIDPDEFKPRTTARPAQHSTPDQRRDDLAARDTVAAISKQYRTAKHAMLPDVCQTVEPSVPTTHGGAWFDTPEIPLYWISLLLNATHTAAPLIAIDTHRSVVAGRISAQSFTVSELQTITGRRRATIKNALDELLALNYVQFVPDIETTKTYTEKSVQNSPRGRRAVHYALLPLDKTTAVAALERVLYERAFSDLVAVPTKRMADTIGIDNAVELESWRTLARSARAIEQDRLIAQARAELAKNTDPARRAELLQAVVNAQTAHHKAQRAVEREIHGDGKHWQGWKRALDVRQTVELPVVLDTTKTLRIAMLRALVTDGTEHYRSDLARFLGVSERALDEYYDCAGLTTSPNWQTVELPALPSVSALKTAMHTAARENRGRVTHIELVSATGSNVVIKPGELETNYPHWQAETAVVRVTMRTASTLHYLPDPLDDQTPDTTETPENAAISAETPAQRADTQKRRQTRRRVHIGLTHDPAWLFDQLRALVALISDYQLDGTPDALALVQLDGVRLACPTMRDVLRQLTLISYSAKGKTA